MAVGENVVRIQPSSVLSLGLRELWQYRELLFSLVQREISIRYKQTLIGVAWALLQPATMVLTFTIFFGRLAKIPSGDLPYPLFALTGVLLWSYFSTALSGSANSLVDYRYLLSKVYFPRLVLPLSPVITAAVDFAVALGLLVGMMLFYGILPSLTILLVPVFLLLTALTALSAGLWLAALNAMYRDVRYVLPFFIQLWMFASPVVYPSSLLPERWRWVYALNPMVGLIEGFRWSITGVGSMPLTLGISLSVVVVVLLGGIAYFRKVERTLADWV